MSKADENTIVMLKAQILKKLRRHGYWGGRHTAFDELQKGIPKHLRGLAKDAAEELIDDGLLIEKGSTHERHVSLDPKRKVDIDRIIDDVLGS
jgi:hypothetical protein